jgi:hypothetical protein
MPELPWSIVTPHPRCYCSSYSTSIVASTVLIQCLLQYKSNSMKMVFSINGVRIILSQFESLNFRTPVDCGSLSSVWNFSELIGAVLDHTSKMESVPHNLLYKCLNLQKFLSSESICFKGPNKAIQSTFQTSFSRNCLTIITFGNCISSSNLRDGVCMSTWWESNIYSSIWNTIYQFWISGEFVLEGPTSLSGQLFWLWISISHFYHL